jgi:prepilin-type N-terminal cleavage/methylation domain-containing protein
MSARKLGFTLVELLVVIAIIGVLVSLLLPAVQAAREAARRMQCGNNLKQMGLGVHNYVDTYKAIPVGEYSCCWGTWLVGLLPYVEQSTLYDKYVYFGSVQNSTNDNYAQTNGATRYGGTLNRPVTTSQISVYTCPTDSLSGSPAVRSGITFHNYVANHGNTTLQRKSPHGTTASGAPNVFGGGPFIFIGNWRSNPQVVRLQDIIDGLSSTMLFSETVQGKRNDLRGFAWWNGGAHYSAYLPPNSAEPDVLENISYCDLRHPLNPPCVGPTSAFPSTIAARSRHPGGVQTTLGDGSVRFVSNSISLDIWRAISTTYGKESNTNF